MLLLLPIVRGPASSSKTTTTTIAAFVTTSRVVEVVVGVSWIAVRSGVEDRWRRRSVIVASSWFLLFGETCLFHLKHRSCFEENRERYLVLYDIKWSRTCQRDHSRGETPRRVQTQGHQYWQGEQQWFSSFGNTHEQRDHDDHCTKLVFELECTSFLIIAEQAFDGEP